MEKFTIVTHWTFYARWDLTHARSDWTKYTKTHKNSKLQFSKFWMLNLISHWLDLISRKIIFFILCGKLSQYFRWKLSLSQYKDNWSVVRFEFHPSLNQYNGNWSVVRFEFHPCFNQYNEDWSIVRFEFHPCLNQYNDNWSVVRFEFHPCLLSFSRLVHTVQQWLRQLQR